MPDSPRWTVEQVVAVAPGPHSVAAAEPLALAPRWSSTGADERALWGRCRGSGAEPYETTVDHVEVAWRCTCPSRKSPCKHALALLLLWIRGGVPEAARPASVAAWIEARDRRSEPASGAGPATPSPAPGASGGGEAPDDRPDPSAESPNGDTDRDRSRDERVARMMEGLVELDRWLEDRMRTGLADPALARYATWDALAARLVDARAGALANRVRRLAGLVGAGPDWHADVLGELGMLHLIAEAGRRLPALPGNLADVVATASGWQVRQADVLASVPETDSWIVLGRSDTREDRIEVRRIWLRGVTTRRWAMLLSFAAYRQSLDTSWVVGSVVDADIHRCPGGSLRCLASRRDEAQPMAALVEGVSITKACDEIGSMVAAEPWLEHVPVTVTAAPTTDGARWLLTDGTGSLPMLAGTVPTGIVLAASLGGPLTITLEWTPQGVVPLTLHLADRVIDVGPRADLSFVGRGMSVTDALDTHWRDLVTAALLGTERRSPPRPPVALVADVVDDSVLPDEAARMLATVSAVIAARRAAFVPLPPADRLQPPAQADTRPVTPADASATWIAIVGEWPVLEDEWMLTVIGNGYRLAPDVLVPALMRHRNDPVRRARAALAGGPLSAWLIDHVPGLAAGGGRTVAADAVMTLPELAIPPELAELTRVDAHTFARRLLPRFDSGELGPAHRAVLTNLVARCRPEVLSHAAEALDAAATTLTLPLAELCRLRHTMLEQLH